MEISGVDWLSVGKYIFLFGAGIAVFKWIDDKFKDDDGELLPVELSEDQRRRAVNRVLHNLRIYVFAVFLASTVIATAKGWIIIELRTELSGTEDSLDIFDSVVFHPLWLWATGIALGAVCIGSLPNILKKMKFSKREECAQYVRTFVIVYISVTCVFCLESIFILLGMKCHHVFVQVITLLSGVGFFLLMRTYRFLPKLLRQV